MLNKINLQKERKMENSGHKVRRGISKRHWQTF